MAPVLTIAAYLVLLIVSLAGLVASQDPRCSNGGFMQTCAFPGLWFNETSIGMYCLNDMYSIWGYNWTWIDLNMCLTNNNGKLAPMANGTYSHSCTNCDVTFDVSIPTVRMSCDCQNLTGQLDSASIDLNPIIYNIDGSMGCCELMGNKTWKGPQASA